MNHLQNKTRKDFLIASNKEELLDALQNKEYYILIQADFAREFIENTNLPFTETEELGFQLGFRGAAGLFGEVFFRIINLFSDDSKIQKRIDSQIRKYTLKKWNDHELLLYLRQLDY